MGKVSVSVRADDVREMRELDTLIANLTQRVESFTMAVEMMTKALVVAKIAREREMMWLRRCYGIPEGAELRFEDTAAGPVVRYEAPDG